MHFILGAFVASITLITGILFAEVFPKWVKILMIPVGAISTGYAIAILIRKIAILTEAFSKPALQSTTLIATAVMFVVIVLVKVVLNKKKA